MMLVVSGTTMAVPVTLVSHNQKSGTSVSTLIWNGANTGGVGGMTVGAVASTATWDWDGTTLTGMGLYFATTHIGSMPLGSSIIGDRVTDLVINTATNSTSATDYECREGNFLGTVGAHGCGNISLDYNATYDSAMAYNVGGDASCVSRTLGGDDVSTGNPRGLTNSAGGGGCDATDSAFIQWEVLGDTNTAFSTFVLSNFTDTTANGANYMTFQYGAAVVPVPAAVWLFGSALGLLGWIRRRVAA